MQDDKILTSTDNCADCNCEIIVKHGYVGNIKLRLTPAYCLDCMTRRNNEDAYRERQKEAFAKQQAFNKLFEQGELGERFYDARFDNFKINSDIPAMKEAVEVIKGYLKTFEKHKKNGGGLVLIGPKGTGKTHLMAAMAHEFTNKSITVIYKPIQELLDAIYSSFSYQNSQTPELLLKPLRDADVLMLDDIGTEEDTNRAKVQLHKIINMRYNVKRPLIISSNAESAAGFKEWVGERAFERLDSVSWFVMMNWKSYRTPYSG